MSVIAWAVLAGLTIGYSESPLRYDVSIRLEAGEPQVWIEMEFVGGADGRTQIRLPNAWGGESELWRGVSDLEVDGESVVLSATDRPYRYDVAHAPGAAVTVRYRIVPDRAGPPSAAAGDYYRPYVMADYVHMIGYTVFIQPDLPPDAPVRVSLSAPEGWTLASDLQHGVADRDDVRRSVIVAGDFRVLEHALSGAPLRLAVRGDIEVDDDELVRRLDRVVAANLQYWGDEAEPYLVTVLPLRFDAGFSSIGGTNLGDSFAMFVTPDPDLRTLTRMLAHEHTHTWNVKRLGGPLRGADEPAGYWFSEGFTDFITLRAGVRGGVFTPEEAIEHWNMFLAENALSPVRDAPNAVIRDRFWTDRDVQRLPYHRGMLFAALIDYEISAFTGGARNLDTVMQAMLRTREEGPAPARFSDMVKRSTGLDVAALIERHIEQGAPMAPPADLFGACGALEWVERPIVDYGMTLTTDAEGRFVIESVDPDGPAYPAGFRPGMIVIERLAGAPDDAGVDSVLRVRDGEAVRDLRYRPTSGETLRLQQILPVEADLAANGCAAALAGRAAP